MGKPRMIIIMRHGQSEGNKNRDIHQTIPDHRVKLTADGWSQAHEAGRRLRSMLREDDTLHFFTSPYRRTRETTEGILSTLTSDDPERSPFPRQSIKVYEEPRLREQDFGNFQPCSAEMERMWQERADYGHFFYRIPDGESAADAYDRISGFNESLWRQFGEDDLASVCVLGVTHGLMSRVFLMKWYHFSVEYFEDLRNVNHCEPLIMRKQDDSGKYHLETKMRTWSQLKRDRLAAQKEREKSGAISEKDKAKSAKSIPESPSIPNLPFRKRWGGCPDGCDHSKKHHKKEKRMHAMQVNGKPMNLNSPSIHTTPADGTLASRRPAARRWNSGSGSVDDDDDDDDDTDSSSQDRSCGPPKVDVQKSVEAVISSPDGTPSFISIKDRLRNQVVSPSNMLPVIGEDGRLGIRSAGRGLGGSASGKSNRLDSDCDTDLSPDEDARKRMLSAGEGRSPESVVYGAGNRDVDETEGVTEKAPTSGRAINLKARPAHIRAKELPQNGDEPGHAPKEAHQRELSGMGRGAMADALGDQSDVGSDGGRDVSDDEIEKMDMEALEKLEREEKSVEGSIY